MAPSGPSTEKQLEPTWNLGVLTFWQLTRRVVHGIDKDDLFGRASELAYNFLLALFPLLLFILTLFGLFASRSNELQSNLLSYFAAFLPPPAFQLLKTITTEMAANATGGKLTFGILLTLWFASGGMSSMISTLNAVYHVRESRSWFRGRVIALGLTIAILILLLTSLFIVLAGEHLTDWIGIKLHLTSIVVIAWKGLQWVAVVLFLALSFSLIIISGRAWINVSGTGLPPAQYLVNSFGLLLRRGFVFICISSIHTRRPMGLLEQ
jgi:membrane protein